MGQSILGRGGNPTDEHPLCPRPRLQGDPRPRAQPTAHGRRGAEAAWPRRSTCILPGGGGNKRASQSADSCNACTLKDSTVRHWFFMIASSYSGFAFWLFLLHEG